MSVAAAAGAAANSVLATRVASTASAAAATRRPIGALSESDDHVPISIGYAVLFLHPRATLVAASP